MHVPSPSPQPSPPSRLSWWLRWAGWSALVSTLSVCITIAILTPNVWKGPLRVRSTVDEAGARAVLYTTVGHAMVHGPHNLCLVLGTHPASSCTTSLQRAGAPPGRAPGVRCVTQLHDGPFAGGMVLTVRGRSDLGEPYTTDFVVIDQGQGPQPLDPVYWSGLHLVETNAPANDPKAKTATWRYDGASTRCQ